MERARRGRGGRGQRNTLRRFSLCLAISRVDGEGATFNLQAPRNAYLTAGVGSLRRGHVPARPRTPAGPTSSAFFNNLVHFFHWEPPSCAPAPVDSLQHQADMCDDATRDAVCRVFEKSPNTNHGSMMLRNPCACPEAGVWSVQPRTLRRPARSRSPPARARAAQLRAGVLCACLRAGMALLQHDGRRGS